jgi:hypothetical protein
VAQISRQYCPAGSLSPDVGTALYVVDDSRRADEKQLTQRRLSSRYVFACLRIIFFQQARYLLPQRRIGLFISGITHVGHISQSNRPHVILIVHGRNDTMSFADVSDLPGGRIAMQTDFLPVFPHHEIVLAFNAKQFALDSVIDLQLLSGSVAANLTAFPLQWI